MNGLNSHIVKLLIGLLLWVFTGTIAYAQLQVQAGETTTLSVEENADETYTWELYDQYEGVDFATTPGNCPTDKAFFVSGNTGSAVEVTWLQGGTYLYKVLVEDGCSNNLKMGMVIVEPPPPGIAVSYNCEDGTALLTASDYEGSLLWSTEETTSSIIVDEQGTYSLTQIVNGVPSSPTMVTILDPSSPQNPDITDMPAYIYLGESVTLSTTGCFNGEIHWYADEDLTQEITDISVAPEETTTYYAVCVTDVGCESEASQLVLVVKYSGDDCDIMYENMTITNAISPNDDGKNDVWYLTDLDEYCHKCGKTADVEIYDRWGDLVFEQKNYTKTSQKFDGQAQSYKMYSIDKKLPTGTYFYIINVDGKKALTGWLYINNNN